MFHTIMRPLQSAPLACSKTQSQENQRADRKHTQREIDKRKTKNYKKISPSRALYLADELGVCLDVSVPAADDG